MNTNKHQATSKQYLSIDETNRVSRQRLSLLAWVLGRLLITGESTTGFPFLASALSIFSGVQLLLLGIIGEYIGRMHFRVMRKPSYAIRSTTDRH